MPGLAEDLGNFILDQIPYQNGAIDPTNDAPDFDNIQPIVYTDENGEAINGRRLKIEGPLRAETKDVGFPANGSLGRRLESHYWYFACRPRRVTKAMRLKIRYPNPDAGSPGEPQFLIEHILIGYEGAGGDS